MSTLLAVDADGVLILTSKSLNMVAEVTGIVYFVHPKFSAVDCVVFKVI